MAGSAGWVVSTAVSIARLLLAAVFVTAGVAKLADLPGSRRAIRGFGVPERAAVAVGVLLPLLELAIAIALVPAATERLGSVGALALLLVFMAAIARSMARGEQPDCHCFGQLHSSPAGGATLVRNAGLAGLAGFVLIAGASQTDAVSATGWIGRLSGQQLFTGSAFLLLFGLLGSFSWMLLRQNGRLLLRLEAVEAAVGVGSAGAPQALMPGTTAPAFGLPDLNGARVSLQDLVARGPRVLLIFSDPACGPCSALLPEIGRWQRDHAELVTVALISRGAVEQNRAGAHDHGVSDLLLQENREVAEAYRAWGTPTALLVDSDGRIASAPALGVDRVRALVDEAVTLASGAVNGSDQAGLRSLKIIAS
jgi:peroxiredoxin/uncharacterized membrane protein YphA (DoxX/SURF4 family)